jgi:hypothetical protein
MSNLAPCSWHVKESTGESLVYVGVLSGSNEGCYSAWNLVEFQNEKTGSHSLKDGNLVKKMTFFSHAFW